MKSTFRVLFFLKREFDFGIPSAFRPHSEKARPNFRNSSAGLSPKNDRVLNCKVC